MSGKVDVVGVAWSGTEDEFAGFIANHALTFPQLSDPDGAAVFAHFGIPAQPAWVFIDAAGTAEVVYGAQEPDQLLATLMALRS